MSVAHWVVQSAIALIGVWWVATDGDLGLLLAWCILGTLYALATMITLGVKASRPGRGVADLTSMPPWFDRLRDAVTFVLTLVPVGIGITAALIVIIVGRSATPGGLLASVADETDISNGLAVKFVGVWAMLLAWGMLHWGFAQIYLYRTESALPDKVLDFPGTEDPSLLDHVYFGFTVGTTFAASDVSVLTSRTRWLVMVHSVLSFFLNALIIALAFNTLMGTS